MWRKNFEIPSIIDENRRSLGPNSQIYAMMKSTLHCAFILRKWHLRVAYARRSTGVDGGCATPVATRQYKWRLSCF